jgi:hypothetical protein
VILVLWATPRSTSTAFEWMMRQRGDFDCLHEPWNELYYYGEDRRSRRDAHVEARPGHSYDATWAEILDRAARADGSGVFVKDFVYSVEHHLDEAKLAAMTHSFLVRDPRRVIQGLARHWPDCTYEEVGFESLRRLFDRIAERDGTPPVVIASDDLLNRPEDTIRAYCAAVGIPFLAEALSWEAGERPEVGWYGEGTGPWHDDLRASTGISRPTTEYPPLEGDQRLVEMLERSTPHYEALLAHRVVVG